VDELTTKRIANRTKLAEHQFVANEIAELIALLKLLDDNQCNATISSLENLVAYLLGLSLKKEDLLSNSFFLVSFNLSSKVIGLSPYFFTFLVILRIPINSVSNLVNNIVLLLTR